MRCRGVFAKCIAAYFICIYLPKRLYIYRDSSGVECVDDFCYFETDASFKGNRGKVNVYASLNN